MMTMTRTQESTAPTITSPINVLLAFELGERTWTLGFSTGLGQRPRVRQVAAGAVTQVLEEIERAKVRLKLPAATPVYGRFKARLERRGTRIEDFDAATAAHALALDATLVTANLDHMTRAPGLRIEDWGR